MPPIDHALLLERLFTLLDSAARPAPAISGPSDGLPGRPMAELNAPPRCFAEVFGPAGRLLPHLADQAAATGDSGLADLLNALEQQLNGDLRLDEGAAGPARRLLDYAYPVV